MAFISLCADNAEANLVQEKRHGSTISLDAFIPQMQVYWHGDLQESCRVLGRTVNGTLLHLSRHLFRLESAWSGALTGTGDSDTIGWLSSAYGMRNYYIMRGSTRAILGVLHGVYFS